MTRLRASWGPRPAKPSGPTWRPATQAAIVDVLVAKTLRALKDRACDGWWWPAASAPTGGCARNSMPPARRGAAGALPAAGAVHRQRRDDRAGRGDALRSAGWPTGSRDGAFDVRPRWPLDAIDMIDPRSNETLPSCPPRGRSRIREVANAGMGRSDVLAFWFGESDEVTPGHPRRRGGGRCRRGETFYSHNLGLPELRAGHCGLHQPPAWPRWTTASPSPRRA
jgi:hypothetical protein